MKKFIPKHLAAAAIWLLIFTMAPHNGLAQKFESVKDEKNNKYILKVHFKLPPKAIDSARITQPLVWEFHERNAKNAATSYLRAHYYLTEHLRRNSQNNYHKLLTAIWEEADNSPIGTEALIRQTIKSPIPRSSNEQQGEEITPEELRRQQQNDFVRGISLAEQDYAVFSLREHPEQLDAVKNFVEQNEPLFRCLEEGSHCDLCDFGIPFRETNNPIGLPLSDIQNMREVARALRVKILLEIHEKRFNDAIKSIRVGLAMARHTGKQPLLICGLVGISIQNLMLQGLQEMMSDPDCPNFFWETATIPHPFLNFSDAAEAEKNLLPQTLPLLRKAMDSPESISDAEWRLLLQQMLDFLIPFVDQQHTLAEFPYDLLKHSHQSFMISSYPAARQWFLAQGKTAEEIDAMIIEKVIGLHAVYELQRIGSEYYGGIYLPLWEKYETDEWYLQWHGETSLLLFSGNWFVNVPTKLLLPAINSARTAYRRMAMSSDIMRIAAAIQDYAAQHHGNVPATLDEIKKLPIPFIDPTSGNAYDYKVVNGIGQIYVSQAMSSDFIIEFEIVK
ncbi:MAG: hypothetical protein LBJ67_18050 [Planctomycetaceae bacterium]|jgi:hypothetical protein|nr:hypothetical protein [Planctomycetaceae bacterium]